MNTRRCIAISFVLAIASVVSACALPRAAQIGAGFAAKVTCSLAKNSGQDPAWVIDEYVAHEAKGLRPLLRFRMDEHGSHARVLGVFEASAVVRPGLGCTLVPGEISPPSNGSIAD